MFGLCRHNKATYFLRCPQSIVRIFATRQQKIINIGNSTNISSHDSSRRSWCVFFSRAMYEYSNIRRRERGIVGHSAVSLSIIIDGHQTTQPTTQPCFFVLLRLVFGFHSRQDRQNEENFERAQLWTINRDFCKASCCCSLLQLPMTIEHRLDQSRSYTVAFTKPILKPIKRCQISFRN